MIAYNIPKHVAKSTYVSLLCFFIVPTNAQLIHFKSTKILY